MGVTLFCRKMGHSIDMGYGGFMRLRKKVAMLAGEEFGLHYGQLFEHLCTLTDSKVRDQLLEDFDNKTEQFIRDKAVSIKVVDFLFQSDAEGEIRYGACKELLKIIGNYDDKICYGYAGRPDCAMFRDFKALLKDCVASKSNLAWS